jgi:hypothetical protein
MNLKIIATAALAAVLISQGQDCSAQDDRDANRPGADRATVCRNIVFADGRATAECSSGGRGWQFVSAHVGDCRGRPILSRRGTLSCGGGRRESEPNDYPARASAILFEDADFRGFSLPLRDDMPALSAAGFDRRASSIRVRDGVWEGCTQENYHGRCWKVTSDQSRFSPPANDQIRSIRRVD